MTIARKPCPRLFHCHWSKFRPANGIRVKLRRESMRWGRAGSPLPAVGGARLLTGRLARTFAPLSALASWSVSHFLTGESRGLRCFQEIRRDEQVMLEYQQFAANDQPFIRTAQSQVGTEQRFVFDDYWLAGNDQSFVGTNK